MRHKLVIAALAAASLVGSTLAVAAQGSTVSPATPPPLISATPSTTGMATGTINQPGVPNTSTPGLIGTGAAPSGLIGDSTHHPGYPGRHPK